VGDHRDGERGQEGRARKGKEEGRRKWKGIEMEQKD
jgi:hypothetical protein